jgi:hypothetical protein
MQINKFLIEKVAKKVGGYFELDVEFGNSFFRVTADSDKAISEFESRLVAEVWAEDNGEEIESYLNLYVDIIDNRSMFRATNTFLNTWEAQYGITPGDETRLYG